MTGPGRLAAERLPHARAGAVLRRAPTSRRSRARACPRWPQVLQAVADAWREQPRRDRASGARIAPRLAGGGAAATPADDRARPGGARRRRRRRCARAYDGEHGGWGGAPKFPAASVIELPARAAASATMAAAHAARDGQRRHLRPGRRRLRPLRVDATLDGPALREDALRQRAAGARLPARAGRSTGDAAAAARRRARRSTGRCASCAGPRAASAARWTPTPRASRASTTCGRSTRCARSLGDDADAAIALVRRRPSAGNFEGAQHPRVRAAPEPGRAAATHPRDAAARRASARVRPGLDDKRLTALERADDRRAGRRRRRARPRRTTSTRRRAAREFVLARPARRRRPAAAHLQPRPGARSAPTSRTTPSCSRRCSTLYEATFEPRWFAEARALADAILDALRRPRARRLLLDRRRPRAAGRPPQGPRGRADPRRAASAAALGLLRLAALTGETRYEEPRVGAAARSLHDDRAAAPDGLRPPAAGARLPPRARARGRARRRRRRRAGRRGAARALPPAPRAGRRPAGDEPSRCSRAARRSTAAPPPTCASASPAGAR